MKNLQKIEIIQERDGYETCTLTAYDANGFSAALAVGSMEVLAAKLPFLLAEIEVACSFSDWYHSEFIPGLVGLVYDDPAGIWRVTSIDGNMATVEAVQDDYNCGKLFGVPLREALFHIDR